MIRLRASAPSCRRRRREVALPVGEVAGEAGEVALLELYRIHQNVAWRDMS
jgi:hypothetical protein